MSTVAPHPKISSRFFFRSACTGFGPPSRATIRLSGSEFGAHHESPHFARAAGVSRDRDRRRRRAVAGFAARGAAVDRLHRVAHVRRIDRDSERNRVHRRGRRLEGREGVSLADLGRGRDRRGLRQAAVVSERRRVLERDRLQRDRDGSGREEVDGRAAAVAGRSRWQGASAVPRPHDRRAAARRRRSAQGQADRARGPMVRPVVRMAEGDPEARRTPRPTGSRRSSYRMFPEGKDAPAFGTIDFATTSCSWSRWGRS